jgi:poly(3-hydroxyalkanoate) depolymerase
MPVSPGLRGSSARTAPTTRSIVVDGRHLRVDVAPGGRARRGWLSVVPGRTSSPATASPAAASGAARGVPLLLINGIGASLELLQPFVAELPPTTEVIRFDPPGVGGSPAPAMPYRIGGLCRLIARMLTVLGYDRVDVLGISWGGGVAQHFAAFQRNRCRRLVLVSTATGSLMVPAKPAVLARMVTPRRYLDPGYLLGVAPVLYGGSARADPERICELMHRESRVGASVGYLYQLAASAGWTSLPFLPLIRQPTLIMAGDDDPLIPLPNARLLHALIPRSRLYVYHGGHVGLVTEAAEHAPVIARFLGEPDE